MEQRLDSTGFGVIAAVDDAVQTAVDNGAGAHGTRLYGHIERAARQTPAAQDAAGFFNGQQLGVGCRAGEAFAQIVCAGNRFFFDR